MPRSEKQKLKILYVAKYLLENSDENHPILVKGELEDYLRDECNINADRRSLYRDIALLRDEFGMDIDGGQGGRFRLLSRQFEFDDLRLLAECVHATKFISAAKAKELVSTISEFCSIHQAEQLQQEVFLCDRVKTTQKGILTTISKINAAMAKKQDGKPHTPQKISFKYLKYTLQDRDTQVERRQGAAYIASPFKLLINEGNYYLLAYDDKRQKIITYRVDRMKNVELLPEARDGEAAFAEIDLENYTRRTINMFSGKPERVSIRFITPLLDTVIERFGTGVDTFYRADGEHHFVVSTEVEISDQFLAWVCGFRNRATIISPPDAVEDMKKFLADIGAEYQ